MMSIAKYWNSFKVDETTNNSNITSSMESKAVGLKILTTKSSKSHNHNSKPIFQRNQIPSSSTNHHPCFLKSCFLCHKHLAPNKDIYMYRGDQGFCSEECRSRQIYIDDVRKLEISTKKMIQKYRQSRSGRRCNATPQRHRHRQKSTPSPIFS